MQFGSYVLDTRRHVLTAPQGEIQLSPLAGRLLEVLGHKPGEIVDRGDIVNALWRGDWLVGDPALNRLVSELRRSVGDDPRNPTLIQTVPRRGYRLVLPAAASAAQPAVPPAPPRSEKPLWRQIWQMGNITIAILFTGVTVLLIVAILAHH